MRILAFIRSVRLTLFGVGCDLLHQSNEVEQELRVVVGQLQVFAVFPKENTRHSSLTGNAHINTLSYRFNIINSYIIDSKSLIVRVLH